ncbi:hypothetical protein [Hyphomonas johnsonii]|uniref:Putative lipoprotein n=1 Tax=Hyphomonas johnsonii MHS-2 TaxID=1280950 RepID=A0A059FTQ0_9PROT|nr:hypothetical protein [Hyphomonas johnsonii]KCZ93848.1 putative lipoprotein [Hyphomonas johnsonii MHS-2]
MRTLVLSLAAIGLLAGCGKSDKATLVASCTAEGESQQACACIADAMETNLSPDLFKRTAQAIGREKQEVERFVLSLTPDDQMEFAAVVGDMFTCKLAPEKD